MYLTLQCAYLTRKTEMEPTEIGSEITRLRGRANLSCKAWSTAFHLSFGIPIITGAIVAAFAEKHTIVWGVKISDYIPFIALIGSVSSAVGVFGGFERKWVANRITRNELDILKLEMDTAKAHPKETGKLIAILRAHDAAITQMQPRSIDRSNDQRSQMGSETA